MRCGTNFLFIVLFLTIVAHFLLDVFVTDIVLPRLLLRISVIPLLAGISYEAIKLASRNEKSMFFKILMFPGLGLQKITTKPPSSIRSRWPSRRWQAVAPKDSDEAETKAAPESPVA